MDDNPVGFTGAWIQGQAKLQYPPDWKGGWERWAQGQIALFMEGTNGYQSWLEEKIFYNSQKAVDLEFRRQGVHKYCELKCYETFNEETPETFIDKMLVDYDKVQLPLKDVAKGSTLWVIGISQKIFRDAINEAGEDNMDWSNFNRREFVCLGGGGSQGTFDVWYWSYQNTEN